MPFRSYQLISLSSNHHPNITHVVIRLDTDVKWSCDC